MKLIPRDVMLNLDEIVEQFFSTGQSMTESRSGVYSPKVDIHETKNGYEISAEMPGVNKEDLEVTLENGVLTVEAEMPEKSKAEEADNERRVLRQERHWGKFSRSFNLGEDIRQEDIDATFIDGVLTLSVPKAESKEPVSRRIPIH